MRLKRPLKVVVPSSALWSVKIRLKTGLADIVGLAKSQGIEVRPTPIKQMNKYDLEVPTPRCYCSCFCCSI